MARMLAAAIAASCVALPAAASPQDAPEGAPLPRGTATASPAATPSAASTQPAAVIFTDIVALPSSQVPGIPGATFTFFDRPFGSRNGNWILTADTDLATTMDELLILNGVVVGQEGTPAPWAPGENFGTLDTRVGVNDAGEYVFSTNVGPTTVDDDFVIRVRAGPTFEIVAQEGAPVAPLPGVTYDDTIDSAVIVDDGRVFFSADGIDGAVTTATDEILVFGAVLLAQEGVTIPTGQAGGAMEPWENFDFEDGHMNADGSSWIQLGDLTGSTSDDDVAVVDGAVVLQENQVIPGSGFAEPIDLSGIVNVSMDPAGNWYARGNNDVTEQDWVVRNGAVIAMVGGPVTTGGTELYDDTTFSDCFFLHVGNGVGDFVLGGVTDAADILRNGVLVLNGEEVICREGDPVDLDGNGMFDDDAFFNTFGNDDGVLTDAREFYYTATLRDGLGAAIGEGFFRIDLVSPPTVYCTAKVTSSGCLPAIGFTGTPSPAGAFHVTCDQVEANQLGLAVYSFAGPAASPFLGGTLCVQAPNLFRTPAQGSGGNAACEGDLDHDMTPVIMTQPAGTSIWTQFWFRDAADAFGAGLSDALSFTTLP